MLKSSGSSYLISGAEKVVESLPSSHCCDCCESILFMGEVLPHFDFVYLFEHTEISILMKLVSVTFKYPMIHGSAIHIAYRILAAFFIDMGAKTSIVENLNFVNH